MSAVKRTKLSISRVALIIGAIIIPLMYSYFYLNAFWDPYSRLDSVPVAVVNEDQGAVISGEERNVGDELTEELKEDGSLDFHFVDEEEAVKGTKGSDYYAMLKIPAGFSGCIASEGTDAAKAKIEYMVNDKRNYLAAQILNNAVNKIDKKLTSNIDSEIAGTMAGKLGEIPDQLATLEDGMDKMYEGSEKLEKGAGDLAAGAKKLDGGVKTADKGASDLADGAGKIDKGAKDLSGGAAKVDKGAGDLSAGADKLDSGLGKLQQGVGDLEGKLPELAEGISGLDSGMNGDSGLKNGIAQYTAGVSKAEAGVAQLKGGADTLVSGISQTKAGILQASKQNLGLTDAQAAGLSSILDNGFTGIESGASELSGGLAQADQGLTQLTAQNSTLNGGAQQIGEGIATLNSNVPALKTGVSQLKSGMDSAKSGSSSLSSGAKKLKKGTDELSSGAGTLSKGTGQLAEGSNTLAEGTRKLSEGSGTLAEGADQLSSGSGELTAGIGEGKDEVSEKVKDARSQTGALEGIEEKAAEPVVIEEKNYEYIPNYGTAFAPYFMSLSLWVGALIIFFGIYYDPKKRYRYLCYDSEKPVLRSFVYLLLGLAQALLLAVIVKYALDLQVANMAAFVTSCALVSIVFMSIVQFFIVHLGDLGKLLAMLMLILQLTACGGTFPMETVPKMFNVLYPFMPMTYSVRLFKETISGSVGTGMARSVTVLVTILVVFMALTILFSLLKFGGRKLKEKMTEDAQPA